MAKWTDKSYAANQARLNNSFMGLNPAYQSTVQEETDRIRRAELDRNRRMALTDEAALREAEPQKIVVPDSDTTAAIMQAQGLDPSVVGLSNESQDQDLPVKPVYNPPTDSMTGRFLLRRALEASRKPIDMQRFEQLAQDRQRAGDFSTLTSLYAGEAGPRYSGYQESYLKKALGEQGDKQLGDYGFASGGEFYETPGIQQGREQEADLAASELLFDAESDAASNLNKTLTANQYSKLMSEVDTDEIALNQLDEILETFKTKEGGVDRGVSVWADQVSANVKTFFGVPANQEEYRLASRKAKLQQIIGLFRTDIVGPGVVTEYDAQRILNSVGGDVGALQNPDIVKEQLAILRSQKLKGLRTKKRQLEYFGARGFEGLYDPGLSLSTQSLSGSPSIPSDTAASGAGQETYEVDF
jgi:hypothetical protein